MNRFDKTVNLAGAAIFGSLGLGALAAAACGAYHQLAIAPICTIMVLLQVAEVRRGKRKLQKTNSKQPIHNYDRI